MINHITQSATVCDFKQNALTRYNHGFKTQNHSDHADISYYGCSITWGVGVDQAEQWTSIVDRECGFTSNNFGLIGIGIDEIAVLFKITTQFFQTKKAVILVPMWARQTMPLSWHYSERQLDSLSNYVNLGPGFATARGQAPVATVEETTRAWFSLPESYYIDRAMISIDQIQYVAQVNNVELFWSAWCPEVYNILPEPKLPQFITDCLGSDGRHPGVAAHDCFAAQVVQAL